MEKFPVISRITWMNHFALPVPPRWTFGLFPLFYYSRVIKVYIPDLNFVFRSVRMYILDVARFSCKIASPTYTLIRVREYPLDMLDKI